MTIRQGEEYNDYLSILFPSTPLISSSTCFSVGASVDAAPNAPVGRTRGAVGRAIPFPLPLMAPPPNDILKGVGPLLSSGGGGASADMFVFAGVLVNGSKEWGREA